MSVAIPFGYMSRAVFAYRIFASFDPQEVSIQHTTLKNAKPRSRITTTLQSVNNPYR